MAFDLMKFFQTGNGSTEDPKPKPKPTSSPQSTRDKKTAAPTVQRDFNDPAAAFGQQPGTRNRQGGGTFDPQPGTRNRQGGGTFDQPKREEPNFLEQMGQGQVDRGMQQQGAVEDIYNWLLEPVDTPGEFFQPVGGTTTRIKTAEAEQAAAEKEAADAREGWATGLGASAPNQRGVKELTWDEYDALSPRQRAAVDANTMLVNAVKADLAGAGTGSGDAAYQESVKGLFGEAGGSDRYAPETVNVLSQLGIKDTTRGDLDLYLDQIALLNEDDLGLIDADTSQWTEQEVLGNKRALNAQQFSGQAISSLATALGGGTNLRSGVSGASTQQRDLNDLFEMLSNRDNFSSLGDQDVSEILGLFVEDTGIDTGTLTRYFEDRLNAFDYGAAEVPADKISTAEFRSRYFGGQ